MLPTGSKRELDDGMISAKSVNRSMLPAKSKEDFGYNMLGYGKHSGSYSDPEGEPAEEPLPGPSNGNSIKGSRPDSRELGMEPRNLVQGPGNDPMDFDEAFEIQKKIAHTEAMIEEIKAQHHQAMLAQAEQYGQFMGNQQQFADHPYARSVGELGDEHSPRLMRFVPDATPGATPRLSNFVPTEVSTADTPRCSKFCPDVPKLPHASARDMVVDDDSPRLSKFVPSFVTGATDSDTTPRLSGMVPSMSAQADDTPRLTHLVPTHIDAEHFVGARGYPDPASAALPLAEGTPRLTHLVPDVNHVQQQQQPARYPQSNGGTPRLSSFMPVETKDDTPRLSSFMPVGYPLDTGSSLMGQRTVMTREPSVDLSSFMPLEHPVCDAAGLAGHFNGMSSQSRDLEEFMPTEVAPYNMEMRCGSATECTPRLSQFVPQ